MKITWLGHACYHLTASSGSTLLTDPFDRAVGYPLPSKAADVVTVSHNHHDHNAVDMLPPGFSKIDSAGSHFCNGWRVDSFAAYHDDRQGELRGRNLIHLIQADGLRIAHLGDLGHQLSPAILQELENVDVLLIPVGGVYTLDGEGAAQLVKKINPRLTIPMHYKTPYLTFELSDETPFLSHFDKWEKASGNRIDVTKDNLDQFPPVLVLNYNV